MKKKKPKNSPTQFPLKSPPQAPLKPPSQALSNSLEDCHLCEAPKIVSDAQIGSPADKVAQRSGVSSDLALVLTEVQANKIVIDELASDPSSASINTLSTQLESIPVITPQRSSVSVKDIVVASKEGLLSIAASQLEIVDAKINSMTPHQAVSNQEASSEGINLDVAPVQLAPAQIAPAQLVLGEGQSADVPSDPSDSWCAHAKGLGKRLSKKGEAFFLPSGEACIKIPNSVIEKHQKSWESFILGQFYSDPPSQGTLHNIVNGIWSKQYRDIAVSKMEGFAFLFRIPNAATRHRVLTQRLWQIEGQTMFVDKWEPGVVPAKPELTSAPIWLELRKVPFQFFNEDGLERIAGLVGHPKFLHPMTKNKTNLEVAKVFTIIDPRKQLPEAVNVQFDSGEICRVLVSSPWMPPVFDLCKEIGHASKRCPSIAKACSLCKAKTHSLANCPQNLKQEPAGRKTRRGRSKDKQKWKVDGREKEYKGMQRTENNQLSKLGTGKDKERGETSKTPYYLKSTRPRSGSANTRSSKSDVQPDSSDVESSDSELEEGEFSHDDEGFEVVRNKKKFSGLKGYRGRGPKSN
ncbi:hypothetical protein BRARA_A01405 [Brassica rapa]|uniref:DUF4283 domain-containing protein n=1 Tax=Brassica campestris TaxID=3711 RepID=A0A398ALP2_BRACM|nr:hypothetical protein BRARA_A01405 [Brassica rapa]